MNLRGSTCIKLYPQDEFMHCVEALDDGTANEVYEKNKIFFSNAEECTLDAQGRFTLNARLKDYAGMENGSTVIMQGHKRTIEIWTNEGFNTMFNGLRTDTNFLDLMDAGKRKAGFGRADGRCIRWNLCTRVCCLQRRWQPCRPPRANGW